MLCIMYCVLCIMYIPSLFCWFPVARSSAYCSSYRLYSRHLPPQPSPKVFLYASVSLDFSVPYSINFSRFFLSLNAFIILCVVKRFPSGSKVHVRMWKLEICKIVFSTSDHNGRPNISYYGTLLSFFLFFYIF